MNRSRKILNKRIKVTYIGCGQCGCQLVGAMEAQIKSLEGNKDNYSFVGINTSIEDLGAVSVAHKIHIAGSKGAAGEREKSEQDLANNIEAILDELLGYIVEDSIIHVMFSLGGGTGSKVAIELIQILKEMGYRVIVTTVAPADNEPLKVRDNARQTFDELDELKPSIGSIYVLDNNATDKLTINKIFASLMSGVLCINSNSQDGNMDLAEIETCLLCPSFSVIAMTNTEKGTTTNIIDILNRDNNIFAKREDKTISVIGMSEAVGAKESQINMTELHAAIGKAPRVFHGYNSESGENVLILSGLRMPYSRIDAMTKSIEKDADIIQESMSAITETRKSKELSLFSSRVQPEKTVAPTNSALSALEKLKAKRISK